MLQLNGKFEWKKAVYEADLQDDTTEWLNISISDWIFEWTVESENLTNFIEWWDFSEHLQ